jgi:hypothetical protein
MNTKVELDPKALGTAIGDRSKFVEARLRRLRQERRLVERAILALTQVSRSRESRSRRPTRHS